MSHSLDIIKASGVARASYYRNFDSKEAIIESYLERQREEVGQAVKFSGNRTELFSCENLAARLEYYLKQKYYILRLYDNGLGSLVQDELNRFAEEMLGDMPSRSTERYELYMLTGAAFNTVIQWLKNGALESPKEIAYVFLNFMSGSKIRNGE